MDDTGANAEGEARRARPKGVLNIVSTWHYVYTLESRSHPGLIYTGQTRDLRRRLLEHNARKVPHTSKFVPWSIRSVTAFHDRQRALDFERYLKSGSGRAFLKRHL